MTFRNACSAECAKTTVEHQGQCDGCKQSCCSMEKAVTKSLNWDKQVAGATKMHFDEHLVCVPAKGKKCQEGQQCRAAPTNPSLLQMSRKVGFKLPPVPDM